MAKVEYDKVKAAAIRFIRVIVPQFPAIAGYIVGIKPEYSAILALVGACLTALDKYFRDSGLY